LLSRVGFSFKDLKAAFSDTYIVKLLNRSDFVTIIEEFIKSQIHFEIVIQRPGDVVTSPTGQNSGHFVIYQGKMAEHIAWNQFFSQQSIECGQDLWRSTIRNKKHQAGNSALDSGRVFNNFWLQSCVNQLKQLNIINSDVLFNITSTNEMQEEEIRLNKLKTALTDSYKLEYFIPGEEDIFCASDQSPCVHSHPSDCNIDTSWPIRWAYFKSLTSSKPLYFCPNEKCLPL
jgi:hypothetical protein